MRYRGLWLAFGWGLVAVIIWLSLTPSPPKLDVSFGDKLGHLAAYGTLMFWFCQIYAGRAKRIAYAIGFIAMGIALEFIQGATGYRSFELLDMAANAMGVALGWSLAALSGTDLFRRIERLAAKQR